jgi:peptidoglycan/LPS O-acetylase OafA/YrhL
MVGRSSARQPRGDPAREIEVAHTYEQYRGSNYFRALDGLRAISILLVLVLHTNSVLWSFMNGGMGVHIFFTISGYLITTLALREEAKRGAVSLRAFYVRRACRILPLYYIVLFFYMVMILALNYHGHRHLLLTALPYYLLYVNEFAPNPPDMPFGHSWSLGVEEKFYLFWPVLAFALWRMRPRWRFIGTTALVLAPLLLDRLHLMPFDARRFDQPLYNSYNGILVGCLLAFLLHYRRSYAWMVRLASGFPAYAVLALFLTVHFLMHSQGWSMLTYSISVALAMVPVLLGNTLWTRPLATRPMVFIGVRSYGIYLVHMMCLSVSGEIARHLPGVVLDAHRLPLMHPWAVSFLILTLACASSLLVATGLNIAVEKPFIALGRRRTRTLTGAAPVAPERMA